MRFLYWTSVAAMLSAFASGGDGRPPRTSSSDYPARQDIKTATIAAVQVPTEQLNQNLPADFSKYYVVVEVAIYPKDGSVIEVSSTDFVLRFAEGESFPETAEEVASRWRPFNTAGPRVKNRVNVDTDAGIVYANGRDPVTGRRVSNVGTYERVGVTMGDNPSRPPPSRSSTVDADRMEARLSDWSLKEGKITAPAAGYLYFRAPIKNQKAKSKAGLELQYTHDGESANLRLHVPAK